MRKFLILVIITLTPLLLSAQVNQEEDIITLKKLTLENILYSLKSETGSGAILAGISCTEEVWGECNFYLYNNFGGVWQKKYQSEPISNLNGKIDNFSFEDKLIYFGSQEAGGSSGNGSYYFNVYNLEDNKLYSLNYYWSDFSYSDHGFVNLEEINNQKVLSFLEQKVQKADIIYRPSNELTLEDHWKIDNRNLYENIFKGAQTIQFRYNIHEKISTEKKSAENQDYILYNFFKGNLYGFKKETKEFFLIWVPSWFYDTTEILIFDDDNVVALVDNTLGDYGARVYINLDNREIYAFWKSYDEK